MTPVFGPDNEAVFIKELRPGDVLVFDRLGLPGGLVQWGDECPANHASIVIDDDQAMEANKGPRRSSPAIRLVKMSTYFTDPAVRTITVLRHERFFDDTTGLVDAVSRRADDYLRDNSDYAYVDVIPVGLLATDRMYGEDLRQLLDGVLRPIMDLIAYRVRKCLKDNMKTMMCSEFVYRCFIESGRQLTIDIEHPLLTRREASEPGPANNSYRPFAPDDLPAGATEVEALWRDLLAPKYTPEQRRGIAGFHFPSYGSPGDPLPDAVSPGDLWRSKSLTPIAAFHRPPERPWVRPAH